MKKNILVLICVLGLSISAVINAQTKSDNTTNSNLLFPCDGVTLGKTTVEELEKLGTRTTSRSSKDNQPFPYFIVKGQKVWFNPRSGLAIQYDITRFEPIPQKWADLGMSFSNSYDQWFDFAKAHNLEVLVVKKPEKENRNGKEIFNATLWILYVADDISYRIELDFINAEGTTSDKNTLSFIHVRAQ